jgi:hypothetical protein
MIGRVIFGGFWSLVSIGLLVAMTTAFGSGSSGGGFGCMIGAALTALYSIYIFRGGRFRFLFF